MALSSVAIYYAGGVCWLIMEILKLFFLPEIPVDLVIDPPVKLKPVTPALALELFEPTFILSCILAVILAYYNVG
jgi:tellurite resistance protein TehA-like permease